MATEIGTLLINIAANQARLEKDMKQARRTVDTTMNRISRATSVATNALRGFVGVLGAREFIRASDQFKSINAAMKIATGSAQTGARAYQDVYQIAMRTGQELQGVADTYRRFAEVSDQLNVTQDEVAQAVDTVSKAMAISGGSAESARAALLQFSQGLAAGVLRGEELNSVMEQSPRLAMLLADGMNVPIGSLRELAKEGKITSDVIIKALKSQADIINEEFADLPLTVGRAFTNLRTSFVNVVGDVENTTGAFAALAKGIDLLASNLRLIADLALVAGIAFAGKFVGGVMLAKTQVISLTAAITGAKTALSLLGGPGGLLFAAASAMAVFTERTNSAEEAQKRLAERMGQNIVVTRDLTKAQIDNATVEIGKQLQELDKKREELRRKYGADDLAAYFGKEGADVLMGGYTIFGKEVSGISEEYRKVNEDIDYLYGRLSSLSMMNESLYAGSDYEVPKIVVDIQEATKAQKQAESQSENLATTFGQSMSEMSQFALQAARNIESTLGNTLYNVLKGNFDNIGSAFGDMLTRMSAELMASQVAKFLLGDYGNSNQIGGILGKIGGAIAGAFVGGGGSYTTGNTGPAESYYGFASGGYTGNGGKYQPAGVVHRGEFVLNAEATRRAGLAQLNRMNKGYANGGYTDSATASGVTINVKNEAGDQVNATAQAKQNNAGGIDVEILVKRVMQNDLRQNGAISQTMSSAFGLRRAI